MNSIDKVLNIFIKILEKINKNFSKYFLEKKIFFFNNRTQRFSFFTKQDTFHEEFEKKKQKKLELIFGVEQVTKKYKRPNKWREYFNIVKSNQMEEKGFTVIYPWFWREIKQIFYRFVRHFIVGPLVSRKLWILRRTFLDQLLFIGEHVYKVLRIIFIVLVFFIEANLIFLHIYIYIYFVINVGFILKDLDKYQLYEFILFQVEYKSLFTKGLEFIFYYLIVPPCKFIWYYLDIILNGTEDYDPYERMLQIKATNQVMLMEDKDYEYIHYLRTHDYPFSKDYQIKELYNYKFTNLDFFTKKK